MKIKVMIPLLLAVAVFILWRYVYPCVLAYHEQLQLFLWSSDYAVARIQEPGGMTRYVAEFIVQYYNNFLVGAVLISLLYIAIQQLAYRIARRFVGDCRQSLVISLLVPLVMMIVTADVDVMTTLVVSYIFCLLAMAYIPLKGMVSVVYAFVVVPLFYWLAGPVVLFFCLYMMLSWIVLWRKNIVTVLLGIMLIVFALACIYLSQYACEYHIGVLFRGVDYFRYPINVVPMYWLLVLPAMCPLFSVVKPKWGMSVEVVALCMAVIVLPFSYDEVKYEQMEYDLLVRMQRWDMILEKSQKQEPRSVPCYLAVNLALMKTDNMSRRDLMLCLGGLKKETNNKMAGILGEVFYHLGMINWSQRFAFEQMEAIPNYNKSGRLMKRLAETSLVSGNYRLTRKYLAILSLAPFYRSWASDIERLLDTPALLENHPVYGPLMHSFPKKDVLVF